jgi:hypothetical protein
MDEVQILTEVRLLRDLRMDCLQVIEDTGFSNESRILAGIFLLLARQQVDLDV